MGKLEAVPQDVAIRKGNGRADPFGGQKLKKFTPCKGSRCLWAVGTHSGSTGSLRSLEPGKSPRKPKGVTSENVQGPTPDPRQIFLFGSHRARDISHKEPSGGGS